MLSGTYLRASISRSREDPRASATRHEGSRGAPLKVLPRTDVLLFGSRFDAAQAQRLLHKLDRWAGLAVVVLGASVTLCAGVWLLERWHLR
jgi:hypothetical protein